MEKMVKEEKRGRNDKNNKKKIYVVTDIIKCCYSRISAIAIILYNCSKFIKK